MATLIAIPLLGMLLLIQSAIVSQIPLLHGTADLPLLAIIAWALQKRVQTAWHWSIIGGLMYNLTSALPFGVPLVAYGLVTGLALVLRKRVWQVPVLAMFFTTFVGTLIVHGISLFVLRVLGDPIPIIQALDLVTLPSLLLNLVLAVPAYAMISDLANWFYPEEIEV